MPIPLAPGPVVIDPKRIVAPRVSEVILTVHQRAPPPTRHEIRTGKLTYRTGDIPMYKPPIWAMLWTWQNADISANSKFNGDFDAALEAISCKAIVMPSRTDLYFPPEDNEYEVSHMPNAELRPIESIWGHAAGGPGANENDARFVEEALTEILES